MQDQKKPSRPTRHTSSGRSDDGHIEDGIPQSAQENSDSDNESDLDYEPSSLEDEERILLLQQRLDAVTAAWIETEEENNFLKAEIDELLRDQEEREEMRTELNEHLKERVDLIAQLARQTLADSESSQADLLLIRSLQEAAEGEKAAFDAAMRALDDDLAACAGAPDP